MRIIVAPAPRTTIAPAVIVGPTAPLVVEPSHETALVIEPRQVLVVEAAPSLTIEAPQRAVWDDLGWMRRQDGDRIIYEGRYRTRNRKTGQDMGYDGRVVERGRHIQAYIADPPPELRRHPKAACFTRTTGPWFQVHWYRSARSADEAVLYVEKIIAECLSGSY
jgi:hypothetical protein